MAGADESPGVLVWRIREPADTDSVLVCEKLFALPLHASLVRACCSGGVAHWGLLSSARASAASLLRVWCPQQAQAAAASIPAAALPAGEEGVDLSVCGEGEGRSLCVLAIVTTSAGRTHLFSVSATALQLTHTLQLDGGLCGATILSCDRIVGGQLRLSVLWLRGSTSAG